MAAPAVEGTGDTNGGSSTGVGNRDVTVRSSDSGLAAVHARALERNLEKVRRQGRDDWLKRGRAGPEDTMSMEDFQCFRDEMSRRIALALDANKTLVC